MSEATRPTQVPPLHEVLPGDGSEGSNTLAALMDVSMPIIIEIGRTTMTVNEVLEVGVGSVIQLDRMVGEPVDVFVSDRKLAEGEVVVIGEQFGVRITRLITGTEGGNEA